MASNVGQRIRHPVDNQRAPDNMPAYEGCARNKASPQNGGQWFYRCNDTNHALYGKYLCSLDDLLKSNLDPYSTYESLQTQNDIVVNTPVTTQFVQKPLPSPGSNIVINAKPLEQLPSFKAVAAPINKRNADSLKTDNELFFHLLVLGNNVSGLTQEIKNLNAKQDIRSTIIENNIKHLYTLNESTKDLIAQQSASYNLTATLITKIDSLGDAMQMFNDSLRECHKKRRTENYKIDEPEAIEDDDPLEVAFKKPPTDIKRSLKDSKK